MSFTGLARTLHPSATARILYIDIERTPELRRTWGPKVSGGYLGKNTLVEEARTICAAWRFLGEDKTDFQAVWHKGGDQRLAERTWEAIDKADVVVTYNGRRFDLPILRTDWVRAGLPPVSPYKDLDLLPVVRQTFGMGLAHKDLDSVSRFLGKGGKHGSYNVEGALAAVAGDRKARADLRVYNSGDVIELEEIHMELLPHIHTHPHVRIAGDDKVCNRCGHDLELVKGKRYQATLIAYALYRCPQCLGFSKGEWHARHASTRGIR